MFTENNFNYRIMWSELDGVWIAESPNFPDARAHGASATEALTRLQQVIEIFIDSIRKAAKTKLSTAPPEKGKIAYGNVNLDHDEFSPEKTIIAITLKIRGDVLMAYEKKAGETNRPYKALMCEKLAEIMRK